MTTVTAAAEAEPSPQAQAAIAALYQAMHDAFASVLESTATRPTPVTGTIGVLSVLDGTTAQLVGTDLQRTRLRLEISDTSGTGFLVMNRADTTGITIPVTSSGGVPLETALTTELYVTVKAATSGGQVNVAYIVERTE